MSTVLEARFGPLSIRAALVPALALLYAPTVVDLARGAWREDAYAHGPLVLLIAAALAWRGRAALAEGASDPAPRAGAALLALGLLLWLLGRTQSLMPFEAGSLLPVAAGLVLLVGGTVALKRLAFPLAYLAFFVPLPGFILDQATAPLKAFVSSTVAWVLSAAGYAVEQSGVVLVVNGSEMLIADACSGLNSLMSLLAMGLLYAHFTAASRARMALLALAVVPIAVAANALRVIFLALATVHGGPDAAQGVLHDVAGFAVFAIALLLLVGLDKALGRRSAARQPVHASHAPGATRRLPRAAVIAAAVAMVGAAAAAPTLKPTPDPLAASFDLEAAIPAAFGGWRVDPDVPLVAPAADVKANLDRLYRQIVGRTYVNAAGEHIMLTVAHGGDQSDALKAHRQEVCYRAQGFEIQGIERAGLGLRGREIPVTRFHAVRADRSEPVTYWFTMGDRVVLGRLERLRVQVAHGLRGRVPDGLLVRVSSIEADPARAYAAQRAFATDLLAATTEPNALRLAGAAIR